MNVWKWRRFRNNIEYIPDSKAGLNGRVERSGKIEKADARRGEGITGQHVFHAGDIVDGKIGRRKRGEGRAQAVPDYGQAGDSRRLSDRADRACLVSR